MIAAAATPLALLLLTFVGHVQPLPVEERSIYRFGDMIGCLNKESLATSMVKYNGYGCYCGFGGKGTPVDETDRCCQIHDECYGRAAASGECHELQVYIALYRYNCNREVGRISCVPADKYSWYHSIDPECAALVCDCDKEAAVCFAREKYQWANSNYDRKKC